MTPIIHARNLSKSYQIGSQSVGALLDFSLIVQPGEFAAITGPSGSGKSTCMHLLGCLQTPDEGVYQFDGKAVGNIPADDLAGLRNQHIGFVFQAFYLQPHFTALRNVELPLVYSQRPRSERHALAAEALARVGLGHRLEHHPSQLSGGEMQRVAIARALVNRPKLLLTDEPTGALDSNTSAEIMSLLRELNDGGVTVLVVTHDPEVAAYARRIIELRDGRMIKDEAGK